MSHKWIKLKKDCAFGSKGQTVQVAAAFADERIKLGHADLVPEPASQKNRRKDIESKRPDRPEVQNKAMSA